MLIVAGEYRQQTISATFIIQPARARVLAANALLGGFAGGVVGLAGLTAPAAVVVPWLTAPRGGDRRRSRPLCDRRGRHRCGAVVYGVLGAGLGALIPNATAAIGSAGGYALIVENLVVGLAFPTLLRWFPGGAATAAAPDVWRDLCGSRPPRACRRGHGSVIIVS